MKKGIYEVKAYLRINDEDKKYQIEYEKSTYVYRYNSSETKISFRDLKSIKEGVKNGKIPRSKILKSMFSNKDRFCCYINYEYELVIPLSELDKVEITYKYIPVDNVTMKKLAESMDSKMFLEYVRDALEIGE